MFFSEQKDTATETKVVIKSSDISLVHLAQFGVYLINKSYGSNYQICP
jgi:hypothetical protein